MRPFIGLVAWSWPVATDAKRQMYLTRHCVRASDHDADVAKYTSHSLPDWSAPTGPFNAWCTPAGVKIMEKTGKDLVDSFGVDPKRARFFSDPTWIRDTDTAFAIMKGMDIQHVAIDFDKQLFHPTCNKVGPEQRLADTRARFAVAPLPGDYKTDLRELQEIIGVGPAGRLEDLDGPDGGIIYDDKGLPAGGAKVMGAFGQDMLYSYASNITFLDVTVEQINKFYAWHAWVQNGKHEGNTWNVNEQTWLLHRILDGLKTESATNIFAVHDGNVGAFASLLGLKWNGFPYQPAETNGELRPTPPGAGLLFEYDDENDGAVTVTFVYRVFDHSDEFRLSAEQAARFGSMSEFEQTIANGLEKFTGAKECFDEAAAPVLV